MPPRAKFTREEIIAAAVALVEEIGIDRLTARSLAERLNASPRPIFTVFESMDEVINGIYAYANTVYGAYVENGLKETPAFKGVGRAYIRFANERPRLFQLLFMHERKSIPDTERVLLDIEEHYDEIIGSITSTYALDTKTAKELYFQLWVYSHGIAVLLATNLCTLNETEIDENLTKVFVALLTKIKQDGTL